MKTFFEELFEYNRQMNRRFIETLRELPDGSLPNTARLFSHILDAHRIWNNRIDPREADLGVWEILPPEKYREIDDVNFEHTLRILNGVELTETFRYKNSKGQSFENIIKDILFHVINHSTHHRGQIAAELRRGGFEPPTSDYIFYKR
jgi:uncharacterized damage-inducible protein DinB